MWSKTRRLWNTAVDTASLFQKRSSISSRVYEEQHGIHMSKIPISVIIGCRLSFSKSDEINILRDVGDWVMRSLPLPIHGINIQIICKWRTSTTNHYSNQPLTKSSFLVLCRILRTVASIISSIIMNQYIRISSATKS
jgi:hypothetical protein